MKKHAILSDFEQQAARLLAEQDKLKAELTVIEAQQALRCRILGPWHSRKRERARWLMTANGQ